MERAEFKTDAGSIVFGGGAYMLTSIEGTGGGGLYKTVAQYLNTDGAETLDVLYEPRSITIKGYIRARNAAEMYGLRKEMLRILNGKAKGILEYHCATGTYQTEAELESLPDWGTPSQTFLLFTVYLTANKFYWKSISKKEQTLIKDGKKLKTTFTLPCVFSIRSAVSDVWNQGEVSTPLVIEIYASQGQTNLLSTENGIEIINHTTGKHIMINPEMQSGETVRVDTDNISVTSSVSGNILNKVQFDADDDYETDLSLSLAPGKNELECINYDRSRTIAVVVRYYNMFVGV